MSFEIFSPSPWLIFSFSWHCLLQSRSFNFNEIQISVFSQSVALVFYLKSHPHTLGHIDFILHFLPRVLILYFILGSMIHFEVIFVKGVRSVSRFITIILYVSVQLFQYLLLKRLSLVHYIALALLSKIICLYCLNILILNFD